MSTWLSPSGRLLSILRDTGLCGQRPWLSSWDRPSKPASTAPRYVPLSLAVHRLGCASAAAGQRGGLPGLPGLPPLPSTTFISCRGQEIQGSPSAFLSGASVPVNQAFHFSCEFTLITKLNNEKEILKLKKKFPARSKFAGAGHQPLGPGPRARMAPRHSLKA